jgi:alpha-glucoside transport system substrate-binding protein
MKLVKAVVAVSTLTLLTGITNVATSGAATGPKSILGGKILCKNQYKGKKINMFTPVRDSDTDKPIADLKAGYAPFEKCTGATIKIEGTDQFETQVNVRLAGGNAPDMIDFPQPGLMASLARKGQLKPLTAKAAASVNGDFIGGWKELGTVDGKAYGMPARANIKSLVWYSPEAFKAKGYAIPNTIDELNKLSDKIVADGGTPWCAGIESGVATGWVVTDWMEDFMLRINGEKVYDDWVNHKIAFNDPKVKTVMDTVGGYLKNEKYIGSANAIKAIATTKFQEGGFPILEGKCYMHRQASFYSGIWPDGTTIGDNGKVNIFYLPSAGKTKYMLGAGDVIAAGTNKPETMDAILYSGSNEYFAGYIAKGRKDLTPNKTFDTAKFQDPTTKKFADLLKSSDVFRFDASDLMPGAVGAGTFWTEATKWITGQSTDDTLANIEKSWPAA